VASDVSLCVSLAGCFQVSVGACGSCLDFSVQTAYMGWAGINPAFMGQLSPHPNKMFIALREISFLVKNGCLLWSLTKPYIQNLVTT
jgi:hypothetical protein